MNAIQPVDILLDKPRRLLLNHRAFCLAESEINKRRFAKMEDYRGLDDLMIDANNRLLLRGRMPPMDLLIVMIWAGLLFENPALKIDDIAPLLDASSTPRAELCGAVWRAWIEFSGANLMAQAPGAPSEEKKTLPEGQPNGAGSSPSGSSSSH